ncbi:MAG: hypothetical protein AB7U41_03220 [Dongiaceae bacterium]
MTKLYYYCKKVPREIFLESGLYDAGDLETVKTVAMVKDGQNLRPAHTQTEAESSAALSDFQDNRIWIGGYESWVEEIPDRERPQALRALKCQHYKVMAF